MADAAAGRPPGARFHDLDALRAFSMLAIVFSHVMFFVLPPLPEDPWPVHDAYALSTPSVENPYVYLSFFLWGAVLPLFFLLSGYFAALTLRRRGLAHLVRDRLLRLGGPLLVGVATMLQMTGWLFGTEGSGLFYNPVGNVHGIHYLWFLYNLLLVQAVFAVLVRLGLTFRHPLWLSCIPLAVVVLYPMELPLIVADNTGNQVAPDPKVLVYYGLFFLVGVFLAGNGVTPRRRWAWALPAALLAAFPLALYLVSLAWPVDAPMGALVRRRPGSDAVWAAAAVVEAAFAWLACFGLMGSSGWLSPRNGAGRRSWRRLPTGCTGRTIRWCSGCRCRWPTGRSAPHLKVLFVMAATLAVLLAAWPFVRETPVGTMLNGKAESSRINAPAAAGRRAGGMRPAVSGRTSSGR